MTNTPNPASTQEDAENRFRKYSRYDPYHDVAPSLLNSYDIHRYIATTGMVQPYKYKRLKSASYSICIGQRIIYWDDSGKRNDFILKPGQIFELQKNSIVFVETHETFRLPDYMAIRFNLKIDLVHKGILLGTGPLVDPGYEGTLLIPLHNLTSNTYFLYGEQEFVWVEFTKTSAYSLWYRSDLPFEERERKYPRELYPDDDLKDYRPFPSRKKRVTPSEYLADAFPSPIRSSLPDILTEVKNKADQARTISSAVLVSVIVLVVTMLMLAHQLVSSSDDRVEALRDDLSELRSRITEMEQHPPNLP